ncbi:MAG: hypothetical protein EA369_00615 [Bradymonadales bacterium]|nr:MAG: hypothetical protein EA369_00615 [Bradymonadales bacterium]
MRGLLITFFVLSFDMAESAADSESSCGLEPLDRLLVAAETSAPPPSEEWIQKLIDDLYGTDWGRMREAQKQLLQNLLSEDSKAQRLALDALRNRMLSEVGPSSRAGNLLLQAATTGGRNDFSGDGNPSSDQVGTKIVEQFVGLLDLSPRGFRNGILREDDVPATSRSSAEILGEIKAIKNRQGKAAISETLLGELRGVSAPLLEVLLKELRGDSELVFGIGQTESGYSLRIPKLDQRNFPQPKAESQVLALQYLKKLVERDSSYGAVVQMALENYPTATGEAPVKRALASLKDSLLKAREAQVAGISE